MKVEEIFPEINLITNPKLRDQVARSLEKALRIGGWKDEDLKTIPFTLLISNLVDENLQVKITLVEHIRAVTQLCIATYDTYTKLGIEDKLDKDELIAGALLHDVGKFVEYQRDETGKIIQTQEGKRIRHPVQGLELVQEFGLPLKVRQAIVFHSKEGDKIDRFPEVEIIHRCDFLCFAPVKKMFESSN
ncbi:MAG: HD domain-containing protein [Candidatus Heimdallarchaeaceae archaeon]